MEPYAPNPPRIGAAYLKFALSRVRALIFADHRLQAPEVQGAEVEDSAVGTTADAAGSLPNTEVRTF